MNDKNLDVKENQALNPARRLNFTTPSVDIYAQGESLILVADLPGVSVEQLQIDIDQGVLSLEAALDIPLHGESLVREFAPCGYYRQFQLPDHLDLDRIEAQLQNGVLTLKLPRSEQVLAKRIEVKVLH